VGRLRNLMEKGLNSIMEDPVLNILRELMYGVAKDYRVVNVEINRGDDEIKITFRLRPLVDTATIPLWRLLDLEERIMRKLSFEALFSHSRIGLAENGDMIITYIYRKINYK